MKEDKSSDFNSVYNLVKTSIALLEADIYPELDSLPNPLGKIKAALVNEVCQHVARYFANNIQTDEIAEIAFLLSTRSVKHYYDYCWLYEERSQLFAPMIEMFSAVIAFLAKNDGQFSPKSVAQIIFTLSAWHISRTPPYLISVMKDLLDKGVQLFLQKKTFSPEQSFLILDGLTKIWFSPALTSRNTRFFETLAHKALPLLLADPEPLKMFESRNWVRFRVHHVKRLLPPLLDFSNTQNSLLFHVAMQKLLDEKGECTEEEIYAEMPKDVFKNKKLHLKLLKKENELSGRRSQFMVQTLPRPEGEEGEEEELKEDEYQNRYHLKDLAKHIQAIYEENNPRGLVWLIKKFSDNILNALLFKEKYEQENMPHVGMNFHPGDIRDFLKTIRKYAFEQVVMDIAPTIAHLCKQTFNPINFKIVDNDLAIELLWINLVFSTLTQNDQLAFSKKQQKQLFSRVISINVDQARALFAIKAAHWYGGSKFPPGLFKKMKSLAVEFPKSSSPNYEEIQCYNIIEHFLYADQKQYLHHGCICRQTGREIDVAYISPRFKCPIHIDGAVHYHLAFRMLNINTLFRNKCLEQAGWISHVVDITLSKQEIVASLQKIIALLREDTQLEKTADTTWKQDALLATLFDNKPQPTTMTVATSQSQSVASASSSVQSSTASRSTSSVSSNTMPQSNSDQFLSNANQTKGTNTEQKNSQTNVPPKNSPS